MPTGYTAAIKDGITFEQYALGCARAFGATILMRDDPADAPIPEAFEPSDCHSKRMEEAQDSLAKIRAMSSEECDVTARAEFLQEKARLEDAIAGNDALKRKYEQMLSKVEQFIPPTSEHVNFRDFMRSQIAESIAFDCGDFHTKALSELREKTGAQWKKRREASAIHDIAYHAKAHNEEVERAESRTAWISNLRTAIQSVK